MSRLYWLALCMVPGIGGATVRRLVKRFGSAEAVLAVPDEDLLRMPCITNQMVAHLRAISLDVLQKELAALTDQDVRVVTWDDYDYPSNLRPLSDAPLLLFMRGTLHAADAQAVAVVGTRAPKQLGLVPKCWPTTWHSADWRS